MTFTIAVEAGRRILRSTRPEVQALEAWGERIALRRGKRIAVVALARKLACILYAMWRDNTPYRAPSVGATHPIRIPKCAGGMHPATSEREQKTERHLASRETVRHSEGSLRQGQDRGP